MVGNDYYNVLLASLMHDIGKPLIRSGGKGSHYEAGAQFVENYLRDFKYREEVAGLIRSHHSTPAHGNLAIVKGGDSISASFREAEDEEGKTADYENRLIPIIQYRSSKTKEVDTFPITLYSDFSKRTVPMKKGDHRAYREEYSNVKKVLEEKIKVVNSLLKQEYYHSAINVLDSILKETLFFIPADTRGKGSHISLYSHMHSAAMVSACLMRSTNNEKPFLLLRGSITGIQRFITNLRSRESDRKGLSKVMRGRSFLINLLPDAIVHYILTYSGMELTNVHIIQVGAGKFMLMLPNNNDVVEALSRARNDIDKFLLEFNLKLEMAYVEASRDDLKNEKNSMFSKKLVELDEKLNEDRWHPLRNIDFTNSMEMSTFKKCKYCSELIDGTHAEDREDVCNVCRISRELGKSIAKSGDDEVLVVSYRKGESTKVERGANKVHVPKLGDMSINFFRSSEVNDFLTESAYHLSMFVNSVRQIEARELEIKDVSKITPHLALVEKLVGSGKNISMMFGYLPMINSEEFSSEIESLENKISRFYVGHIMVDGDDFGRFFRVDDGRSAYLENLEDYLILTSMIDYAFYKGVGYVYSKLLYNKSDPDTVIYNVFSGGDDIYVVTKFDSISIVLNELKNYLHKFFAGEISVSGGCVITKPSFPVWLASEMVRSEEGIAKKHAKDRENGWLISIYRSPVLFDDLVEISEKMRKWRSSIPSSFTYKLLELRYALGSEISRTKFSWRTKYLLERAKERCSGNNAVMEYLKYLEDNLKICSSVLTGERENKLKVALNQALLYSSVTDDEVINNEWGTKQEL